MLTKSDLKSIDTIVKKRIREEVEAEIQNAKDDLQAEQKMNLIRTLTEIRKVQDRLKNVEIKVGAIQRDLKSSIDFLDKFGLGIQKRVKRIEEHLGLQPTTP